MTSPARRSNSIDVGGITAPSHAPVLVVAAIIVVCMFLPWLHVPIAQTASMIGAFTGQNVSLSSDYTILGLSDLAAMIPVTDEHAKQAVDVLHGYIFAWGAAVAAVVAGAALYCTGKKWLLIAGCVMSTLVALTWCGAMMYVLNEINKATNGIQIFSVPPWPYATVIASIATLVLAVKLNPSNAATNTNTSRTGSGSSSTHNGTTVTGTGRTVVQQPPEVTINAERVTQVNTSCTCPRCGAVVQVTVPNSHCMVNITCGGCGNKFPMEVRPLS